MSHSLHFFSLLSYGLSLHIAKNITHSPCSNVIIYYYSETSSSSLSSSSASRTVSIHCWFQISTHPSSLSTLNLATSVNNCELLGLRNDIWAVYVTSASFGTASESLCKKLFLDLRVLHRSANSVQLDESRLIFCE